MVTSGSTGSEQIADKNFLLDFWTNWTILRLLSHTFFWRFFGHENRQFGDLAPTSGARSPNWQKVRNLEISGPIYYPELARASLKSKKNLFQWFPTCHFHTHLEIIVNTSPIMALLLRVDLQFSKFYGKTKFR